MSNWSPKPLRPMGTEGGLFVYDDEQPVKKSVSNRWQQQRQDDGTPYTRHGASALVPPPAGPRLTLNDLEKSRQDSSKDTSVVEKGVDPDYIVKSYLNMHEMMAKGAMDAGRNMGNKIVSAATKVLNVAGGTSGSKSVDAKDDEDDPTAIEK